MLHRCSIPHPVIFVQCSAFSAMPVSQFEDFNIEHAAPLLERYRYSHVSSCFCLNCCAVVWFSQVSSKLERYRE